VRGVRYYAGRPMAVVAVDGSDFFSPHPVPFLDTVEKVRNFLRTHGRTYALLTEGQAKRIQDALAPDFLCARLKVIGDEHIVEISPRGRTKSR
jgi:hypothetical protein